MRRLSVIALVVALGFATAAAGAGVSTTVGGAVNSTTNAATGNGSTDAGNNTTGTAGADVAASAGGASLDASASASVNASASVGASASNGGSSAVTSASTAASGASTASQACDQVNSAGMSMGAIDATALASVSDVTVLTVNDCSGLPEGTLDAGAAAALAGNSAVSAAIDAAGYQGQQVVGYSLDGTSLTVYVKTQN